MNASIDSVAASRIGISELDHIAKPPVMDWDEPKPETKFCIVLKQWSMPTTFWDDQRYYQGIRESVQRSSISAFLLVSLLNGTETVTTIDGEADATTRLFDVIQHYSAIGDNRQITKTIIEHFDSLMESGKWDDVNNTLKRAIKRVESLSIPVSLSILSSTFIEKEKLSILRDTLYGRVEQKLIRERGNQEATRALRGLK